MIHPSEQETSSNKRICRKHLVFFQVIILFYFIEPFLSEERKTSYIEILCEAVHLNLVFSGVLNYILKNRSDYRIPCKFI